MTLAHQASGIASVIDIALPSDRYLERSRQEETMQIELPKVLESTNKDPLSAGSNNPAEEKDNKLASLEIEDNEEPGDIGKSTFAALEHIRKKGLLKSKRNNIFVGRRNDEKLHLKRERVGEEDDDDGLKLEYRDKSGRLMNRKQAFRFICWGFHNKRPSKLKMAKMEKKIKAEEQVGKLVYLGIIWRS